MPVPFVLAWGPSWWWVLAANVLLGVNQGMTWSMTVNMKIDLVGSVRRGLATGLNEAAGYVAVGTTALLTGYLAASHGLRPAPKRSASSSSPPGSVFRSWYGTPAPMSPSNSPGRRPPGPPRNGPVIRRSVRAHIVARWITERPGQ
ncbi:MFS transporter [Streptomyces atratus]|uniref:MFS transporter n=1 Tax=Streptomyces atratus TaxID=1893 RepID=UPI0036B0F552